MQQQNKIAKKFPGKYFMTEKVYHIYAKDQCIYHSLSEEKFSETWDMLHRMVDFLGRNVSKEDLTYEELFVNKEVISNSSH
jgi:hypothetical protein